MRFDPLMFGVVLVGAALVGCGGDDSGGNDSGGDDPGGAAAGEPSGDEQTSTEPLLTVEGRGESSKLSSVLDVVEGEEASRLAITGTDSADNLIAIYVTFHGLETVVGSHVLPIEPVARDEVFAVGTIDGRVYQSVSGELQLSITSDRHSEGEFEMTLALDASSPLALPAGAPEPATPAAAQLTLVGTFSSEWRVNCRSYISGFTGGHAVSDSPFCLGLTF